MYKVFELGTCLFILVLVLLFMFGFVFVFGLGLMLERVMVGDVRSYFGITCCFLGLAGFVIVVYEGYFFIDLTMG